MLWSCLAYLKREMEKMPEANAIVRTPGKLKTQ
jgi:hypothetical protein